MIIISSNIKDVIRQVKDHRKDVNKKLRTLLKRLHEEGVDLANAKLTKIQYDGSFNITVEEKPTWEGKKKLALCVVGDEITFIEFGTGVHYTEKHPTADSHGMIRGQFGQKRGSNPPWLFKEENGEVGFGEVVRTNSDGSVIVKTLGNPPNRVVYDTAKELRGRIQDIAREVFSDD